MDNNRISRESGARTPSIHDNPDVFSDDFAIDRHDAVVDGFQPLMDQETEQQTVASGRGSTSLGNPTENKNAQSTSISRNSTTKSYGPLDPQRLLRDGAGRVPLPHRTESLRSAASVTPAFQQHRSNSSASSSLSMVHVRSQSPFQGASGPSHPYALYAQGVGVDRSSSVGTSSTLRAPPRSETSSTRPAHPYGMYAQNVFADPEDADVSPVDATIPAGFPGHVNNERFVRRLGPEGEEQDIIGPDGHTEQLPPYTRYPEHLGSKDPALGDDNSGSAFQQISSTETLMPSSDEHNPETTQADAPSTRQSRSVEQMESGVAEKSWSEKSWKERRNARVCGGKFPAWMLVFATILVLLLAVVIGGIVGGFLAHDHAEAVLAQSSLASLQSAQMLSDASTIPTPLNLPSLPTGTFGVPVGVPVESQGACLLNPSQVKAWSCQLALESHMAPVNIIVDASGPNGELSAQVNNTDSGQPIQYGAQPPAFGAAPLELVIDQTAQNLGPAYYFQSTYNKVVIVDSDSFDPLQNTKRNDYGFSGGNQFGSGNSWRQRNQVSPGDQPWVCFWNETMVELFIYDMHNASSSASASLSIMVSAASDTLSSSSVSSGGVTSPTPATTTPESTSIAMTNPTSYTITAASATQPSSSTPIATTSATVEASTTSSSSSFPAWGSNWPDNSFSSFPPPQIGSAPPYQMNRRDSSSDNNNPDSNSNSNNNNNNNNNNHNILSGPTVLYPRSIKISERQLPGNPIAPYCVLMQVLDNGQLGYAPNSESSGVPISVVLAEPTGPPSPPPSGYNGGGNTRLVRRDVQNACHCEWVSQ